MNSVIRRNLIASQSGQHCHHFSQILIGWKGEMACELTRAGGQNLSLGSFAVVPGDEAHFYQGLSEDCELLVMDIPHADPLVTAIEQSSDISIYQEWLSKPGFSMISPDTVALLKFTSLRIAQYRSVSAALNCQLLPLLLLQLCEQDGNRIDILANSSGFRIDVQRLNAFLDAHMNNPPDNQQLADLFYLSQSHFYSLFNLQFGMSPQKYVMNRRLEKARLLIQTTQLSQMTIAEELGFSDASSLSRAYKKLFGQTPGQTRRMIRQ
ncbi:AraC family transcriptional regulator [Oceanospirillum sediminis]|uniref:Helix-turn-helix transcriptional regulator n=1 Tax=Oceanospirillum sediminis TaxID=2760088 RepID=A0A839IIF1_9GAMM|nr:AraC family transcriptional regulator [Oceanospirillum sediminis]MBB1485103.1 helix-turn-helix transcriptional regulator [Oceanospirillum sediminis]